MQTFSEEWASAYCTAINAHDGYRQAAADWQLGSLALVARADNGSDTALYLELERGQCHAAKIIAAEQALTDCDIVIEANHEQWQQLYAGTLNPTMAFVSGQLKVSKGQISALLPYAEASEFLIQAAP